MVSVSWFGRAKSGRTIFITSNSCRQQLNGVETKFVLVHVMKAYVNGDKTPLIPYLDNNDLLQNFKEYVRKHLCSFTLIKVLMHRKRHVARVGGKGDAYIFLVGKPSYRLVY